MTTDNKTGLEHLPQTAPPDSIWEHIEARLDENKRRRLPFWIKWTSGIAASLILIGCTWFLVSELQQTPVAVTPKQNNTQISDNKVNPPAKQDTNEAGAVISGEKSNKNEKINPAELKLTIDTSLKLNLASDTVYFTNITSNCLTAGALSPLTFSASTPSYSWGFGDVNATAPITTHLYTSPGSYTINTNGITDKDALGRMYTETDNQGFVDDETEVYAEQMPENANAEELEQNFNTDAYLNGYDEPEKEEEPTLRGSRERKGKFKTDGKKELGSKSLPLEMRADSIRTTWYEPEPESFESYAPLIENEYLSPFKEPLSTFGIDVDNASYANARRMVGSGIKPPKDAVRIEEFVNYFKYDYPQPKNEDPFSINLETASCPWNKNTQIVAIGLQGKEADRAQLPASNLVFLVDVSGSMDEENKLPLVKKSLKLLVDQMGPKDKIAVVTYAGAAGLALPSTFCSEKNAIKAAIDNLDAGGSTAGGEGIMLAYKVADENLMKEGNNRIILVTDGDFNVGQSSDTEMETLIESKRKEGVSLTVCGFGMGNYKDSKMEILADKGNGNYYYIDNFKESKKVFVTDLTGTLFTIAKDVKIQVEFNPKFVKAYRLIGYENRKMPPQDFNDDTKDAGELGAGHTVTALYEVIPVGSAENIEGFMELKYQQQAEPKVQLKDYGDELLTVKLRYKQPDGEVSKLLERTLGNSNQTYDKASDNLRYACGVTAYAMLLRDSKFKGEASYSLAKQLLESTNLNKDNGYRDELMLLISQTEQLAQ